MRDGHLYLIPRRQLLAYVPFLIFTPFGFAGACISSSSALLGAQGSRETSIGRGGAIALLKGLRLLGGQYFNKTYLRNQFLAMTTHTFKSDLD